MLTNQHGCLDQFIEIVKAMTQNKVSKELFLKVVFFPPLMGSNMLISLSSLLLTAVMTLCRWCQELTNIIIIIKMKAEGEGRHYNRNGKYIQFPPQFKSLLLLLLVSSHENSLGRAN